MNMQVTKTQATDKLQEIESALQSIAFYIGRLLRRLLKKNACENCA
jgi:hypothetical protein